METDQNIQTPLGEEDIARLYRALRLIRRVEERIAEIYPSDKIKSPVHLSIGQEAISVGLCDALNLEDYVSGTYRGHALYLAKGGDLNAFMAELYGKVTGCAQGKGGSMHMIDLEARVLGCSAVVATHIPVAMGYAWKLKQEGQKRIVACVFGDGATEEGVFYETLNFAALHKLPILFLCENNGLAIHSPLANRWAHHDICERVLGFNLPTHKLEEMDVFAIREKCAEIVERIRQGAGPEFLECFTYRWRQHVGPGEDFDHGFRNREDLAEWRRKDQVAALGMMLPNNLRADIDSDIEREVERSITFAEESAFPKTEQLMAHVYAES